MENSNLISPLSSKSSLSSLLISPYLMLEPTFFKISESRQLLNLKLTNSFFDSISNPLLISQPLYPLEDFDSTKLISSPTPIVFQGKDETIPPFTLTSY